MNRFHLAVAVMISFVAFSCQKYAFETSPVDVRVEPVSVAPEDIRNWPRTVFVFDKTSCVDIFEFDDEASMKSVRVGRGYKVVMLAYDTRDNLLVTPSVPGSESYRYKVQPVDFDKPMPQMWYGSATCHGESEISMDYVPLTSAVCVNFDYIPEDVDSVAIDIVKANDVWYPVEMKAEMSTPGGRVKHLVLTPDKMKNFTTGIFPMLDADSRVQIPVKVYYKDRYSTGILPFRKRVGYAESCRLNFVASNEKFFDNVFNVEYSLTDILTGEETKGEDVVSLWNMPYTPYEPQDETVFDMKAGLSFAFQFGSNGVNDGYRDDVTEFHWDSRDRDIKLYTGLGFDHIRIPFDEGWCFFSDGTLKPNARKELLHIIDGLIEANPDIRIIIDLHWLALSNMFPHSRQEIQYRKCWELLHDALKDYPPENVAYELLNEADGVDGYWNTFVANSIDMIRGWGGNELRRVIFCATGGYQDIDCINDFDLPERIIADPNLVLTFHSYAPVWFCFYGTGFSPSSGFDRYSGPIHYPGRLVTDGELADMQLNRPDQYEGTQLFRHESYDKERLYNIMLPAKAVGERLKHKIWVGEYGASMAAPYNDRVNYYKDVCSVFNNLGYSYSFWFSIAKQGWEDPDPAIVDAILCRGE